MATGVNVTGPRISRVAAGVARKKTLTAEYKSNLQLFTGNGNASIEVKNSLNYFYVYSVVKGGSLRNREVQRSFYGNGVTSNLPL